MANIQIVIDISKEKYNQIINSYKGSNVRPKDYEIAIINGTPLPKGHGFIAICDSDFPITEEVKQELKNTVFVGTEDCSYCFDITEIIEADKIERKDEECGIIVS